MRKFFRILALFSFFSASGMISSASAEMVIIDKEAFEKELPANYLSWPSFEGVCTTVHGDVHTKLFLYYDKDWKTYDGVLYYSGGLAKSVLVRTISRTPSSESFIFYREGLPLRFLGFVSRFYRSWGNDRKIEKLNVGDDFVKQLTVFEIEVKFNSLDADHCSHIADGMKELYEKVGMPVPDWR